MNPTADSVDTFLQVVADHLTGPSKDRAAILAELNDGLIQATESHQRTGLNRAQALEIALGEFGDPQALAESFRPELLLTRARRSALTLLTAAPIVLVLWIVAARSRQTTPTARLFDSPTDHAAAALLLAALIASGITTLLVTGRLARWVALPPRAPVVSAAAMGLITVIGDLATIVALGARLARYPGTLHTLVLAAAITASCTSMYLGPAQAGHASRSSKSRFDAAAVTSRTAGARSARRAGIALAIAFASETAVGLASAMATTRKFGTARWWRQRATAR